MVMVSPVRGLWPWRSFLSFTTKLPNPRKSTRSFPWSASAIIARTESTATSTSDFFNSVLAATFSINCCFVILFEFSGSCGEACSARIAAGCLRTIHIPAANHAAIIPTPVREDFQGFLSPRSASPRKKTAALVLPGRFLGLGPGPRSDYTAAFALATESAKQGDIDAQRLLAKLYREGKGTEPDPEKARQWERRAADAETMAMMKQAMTPGNMLGCISSFCGTFGSMVDLDLGMTPGGRFSRQILRNRTHRRLPAVSWGAECWVEGPVLRHRPISS